MNAAIVFNKSFDIELTIYHGNNKMAWDVIAVKYPFSWTSQEMEIQPEFEITSKVLNCFSLNYFI